MRRTARARRGRDPLLGVSLILAGSLLTFFVVGLVLVPVGIWLLPRRA